MSVQHIKQCLTYYISNISLGTLSIVFLPQPQALECLICVCSGLDHFVPSLTSTKGISLHGDYKGGTLWVIYQPIYLRIGLCLPERFHENSAMVQILYQDFWELELRKTVLDFKICSSKCYLRVTRTLLQVLLKGAFMGRLSGINLANCAVLAPTV